jgi:hypothetical protein
MTVHLRKVEPIIAFIPTSQHNLQQFAFGRLDVAKQADILEQLIAQLMGHVNNQANSRPAGSKRIRKSSSSFKAPSLTRRNLHESEIEHQQFTELGVWRITLVVPSHHVGASPIHDDLADRHRFGASPRYANSM